MFDKKWEKFNFLIWIVSIIITEGRKHGGASHSSPTVLYSSLLTSLWPFASIIKRFGPPNYDQKIPLGRNRWLKWAVKISIKVATLSHKRAQTCQSNNSCCSLRWLTRNKTIRTIYSLYSNLINNNNSLQLWRLPVSSNKCQRLRPHRQISLSLRTTSFRWFRLRDRNRWSRRCKHLSKRISSCSSKIASSSSRTLSRYSLRIRPRPRASNHRCRSNKFNFSKPIKERTSWSSSLRKSISTSSKIRYSCRLIQRAVLAPSAPPSSKPSKRSTTCRLLRSFSNGSRTRWRSMRSKLPKK